jgi:hypothetical protein
MNPEPVTPPESDFGRRAQSLYDLEETLVRFIAKLMGTYMLDNPTLNLAQASITEARPKETPYVPFDYEARAQTLTLKVPPRVERGRVPRTVTGEIAVDKLPDCPAIIVQAVSGKIALEDSHTTMLALVRILINAYDENPDGGGYQDVQNMVETIATALTSYGQAGIDQAYPIELPMEWKLIEADTFPHYIAEMTTQWVLPAGRPLPDSETFGIVPAEHIDFRASYPGAEYREPPPPYVKPPPPPEPVLIYSWPVENQDDAGNSYGIMGGVSETDPFAMTATYQALVMPVGGKLASLQLWVKPRGALCDFVVQLYAAVGAAGAMVPTGPVLATSNRLPNASLVTGGSMQEFVFEGANQYALVAGQLYAFVFTYVGAFPAQGEYAYLGMHWAQTLPNNVGFHQGGWQTDDFGTLTFYLYALP